ncbi:MAG: SHOCT domain-containing protein [Candidatus Sifarchaeia archaeon]
MFGGFMWLIWILLIVGIILVVRWAVLQRGKDSQKSEESPLEILKKRYAQGEIDREEFEQKRKDLIS